MSLVVGLFGEPHSFLPFSTVACYVCWNLGGTMPLAVWSRSITVQLERCPTRLCIVASVWRSGVRVVWWPWCENIPRFPKAYLLITQVSRRSDFFVICRRASLCAIVKGGTCGRGANWDESGAAGEG